MRIYYAAPGKLDALNTRFRDHTCKLFEKHGMVNIGYWLPMTNTENKLVYLLAYPSREAREKSWKEFMADPDWQSRGQGIGEGWQTRHKGGIHLPGGHRFLPRDQALRRGRTARVRTADLHRLTRQPGATSSPASAITR